MAATTQPTFKDAHKTTTIQQPRFKATYQGQVIGWYDTADEAQAAIDKLEAEEDQDY